MTPPNDHDEAEGQGLVPFEDYHADKDGDRPSLSCSIIKLLWDASPLHGSPAA